MFVCGLENHAQVLLLASILRHHKALHCIALLKVFVDEEPTRGLTLTRYFAFLFETGHRAVSVCHHYLCCSQPPSIKLNANHNKKNILKNNGYW